MILRAGLSATHLVSFADGHPDGDVTWSVLADGVQLDAGTITPASEAVSVVIALTPTVTALVPPRYLGSLDVVWSYDVDGETKNDEARYDVEARLPLGVSAEGVRRKLGLSESDLPDSEIGLANAYLTFSQMTPQLVFDAVITTDPYIDMKVREGIEALAALTLIPTMPVRVASSESSGTNEFKRQQIDWTLVGSELSNTVTAGLLVANPVFDPLSGIGDIFLLATPSTDAFTGTTG